MAELTYTEQAQLEDAFDMGGGYVLDFSNRTLQEFVQQRCGIDIYADRYDVRGTSKANRLRAFWNVESDRVVAELLDGLLEYCRYRRRPPPDQLVHVERIRDRLTGGNSVRPASQSHDKPHTPPRTPAREHAAPPRSTPPPERTGGPPLRSNHGDVIDALTAWTRWLSNRISVGGVFAFGSLVIDRGDLFERGRSDVDLLVILPSTLRAVQRVSYCATLLRAVQALESQLLPVLRRDDAGSPIISVLPVTQLELDSDVHKSRNQRFYDNNWFLQLDGGGSQSLTKLSTKPIALHHLAVSALSEVQGARNRYLSVAPNGKRKTQSWNDQADALPKDVCRAASMVRYFLESPGDDSQFNVNEGLRYLMGIVHGGRTRELDDLSNVVLSRQGGRGVRRELCPDHLLLLWELLFDSIADSLV